ncbi:MAG: outer membrane lipoprotein carrier protein LolA [Euryarchaeota archaeon]|nr:outer membrane lipoprotein carrier protein LolA [Euryarchaeota archaeon]
MRLSGSSRQAVLLIAVVGIGLVAAGAATGLPGVAQMDQPSGDEILDDVEQRYDDAETLTGTAEVTVNNDSETKEATVDFAFAEPDQFRFVIEKDDTTSEVGSNGSVAWAVGEEESFAREIPADGEYDDHEQPDVFVPDEDVDAELVDTTELDGEEAYVIELTPTDDADEKFEDVESTVWVSTDDSRVLQVETTDGDKETRIEVTDQQFDVSIHDSTFEPPEDRVEVTMTDTYDSFDDLEASTDLDVPEYDDGEFEAATVFSSADGEGVIQEYTTDDGEVQLITATGAEDRLGDVEDGESVTVDGEDATAVERDDRSVVFWTDDKVTTGVVVDGSVDDAVAVAEEIR